MIAFQNRTFQIMKLRERLVEIRQSPHLGRAARSQVSLQLQNLEAGALAAFQLFLLGIQRCLRIDAGLPGRVHSLESVLDLLHRIVNLDEDRLFEALEGEQELFFLLLADAVIGSWTAVPERQSDGRAKSIIGTAPVSDLAEGVAVFLARPWEPISAYQIQLGKQLVIGVAENDVLPFDIQPRLQQVRALGHPIGPTVL